MDQYKPLPTAEEIIANPEVLKELHSGQLESIKYQLGPQHMQGKISTDIFNQAFDLVFYRQYPLLDPKYW